MLHRKRNNQDSVEKLDFILGLIDGGKIAEKDRNGVRVFAYSPERPPRYGV
jgi:hypothetical protein